MDSTAGWELIEQQMRKLLQSTDESGVMERTRRKDIKHHVSGERVDRLLRETEDVHRLRRIGFVKNLYRGDTVPEAAEREGRSPATGDRWADAWNEGGFEELMPSFGGGRPSKLDEDQRQELLELLREGQPWESQEIQQLLNEEFDVEYHPNYLTTVLRDLGLSYAKSRPKQPNRPDNQKKIPNESEDTEPYDGHNGSDEGGWVVD
jgi:transposase